MESEMSAADEVRARLDRVLAAYHDMDTRFTAAGGLGSVLRLYEQVRRELDRVSYEELDGMTREIKGLVERLLELDYELRRVNNLKLALDGKLPVAEA